MYYTEGGNKMKQKENKRKILVTGVGGDIGQGIIKCLRELEPLPILIGCDIDKYAAGSKFVDNFHVSPRASEEENYVEFIKLMIKQYDIEYIIPSTEYEIKVINKFRSFLDKKEIKLLINNDKIITTFLDKYETYNFFRENELPFPETYLVSEFKNQLAFPFILKLKESAGSKGVFKIHDEEELEYYRAKYDDSIVQELIGDIDNEYTIGVFSDGLNTHHIAFRRYLGLGSLSRYVELVDDDPAIKKLADDVAKLTNLKGSINIQVRKTEDKYLVFEINPRISSTVYFRNHFGFEDVKWWLDVMDGKTIKYKPVYKKGIGVKTLDEVFFGLE